MAGLSLRLIDQTDLPKVADLLCEGFPERSRAYWERGLRRLAGHTPPEGVPRFGHLLTRGGEAVGVLLLIHATAPDGGIRCNISSWYVQPALRAYASMMITRAIRDPAISYVNISPAAHTLHTIQAQGFHFVTSGCHVGLPALAPPRPGVRVRVVAQADSQTSIPAEAARLVADHSRFGCLGLWVDTPGQSGPVIVRRRVLRRVLPCATLIHCPSVAWLESVAGPVGRTLARLGMPVLLAGTPHPLTAIPGRFVQKKWPIYARGAGVPQSHDLRYTEAALFGM